MEGSFQAELLPTQTHNFQLVLAFPFEGKDISLQVQTNVDLLTSSTDEIITSIISFYSCETAECL